jgi:hypothetical protein
MFLPPGSSGRLVNPGPPAQPFMGKDMRQVNPGIPQQGLSALMQARQNGQGHLAMREEYGLPGRGGGLARLMAMYGRPGRALGNPYGTPAL